MRRHGAFIFLWCLSCSCFPAYAARADHPQVRPGGLPSFTVTFPDYKYQGSFGSVREIDFRNFTFHIFDASARIELSPSLRDGKFEKRDDFVDDWVALESVHYFSLDERQPERALVVLSWVSTGASSSGYGVVQVFEIESRTLTVSQQIEFLEKPGASASFDVGKNVLTVRAAHYANSDAHCCPSKLDIINFRWTGHRFEKQALRTGPLGENE